MKQSTEDIETIYVDSNEFSRINQTLDNTQKNEDIETIYVDSNVFNNVNNEDPTFLDNAKDFATGIYKSTSEMLSPNNKIKFTDGQAQAIQKTPEELARETEDYKPKSEWERIGKNTTEAVKDYAIVAAGLRGLGVAAPKVASYVGGKISPTIETVLSLPIVKEVVKAAKPIATKTEKAVAPSLKKIWNFLTNTLATADPKTLAGVAGGTVAVEAFGATDEEKEENKWTSFANDLGLAIVGDIATQGVVGTVKGAISDVPKMITANRKSKEVVNDIVSDLIGEEGITPQNAKLIKKLADTLPILGEEAQPRDIKLLYKRFEPELIEQIKTQKRPDILDIINEQPVQKGVASVKGQAQKYTERPEELNSILDYKPDLTGDMIGATDAMQTYDNFALGRVGEVARYGEQLNESLIKTGKEEATKVYQRIEREKTKANQLYNEVEELSQGKFVIVDKATVKNLQNLSKEWSESGGKYSQISTATNEIIGKIKGNNELNKEKGIVLKGVNPLGESTDAFQDLMYSQETDIFKEALGAMARTSKNGDYVIPFETTNNMIKGLNTYIAEPELGASIKNSLKLVKTELEKSIIETPSKNSELYNGIQLISAEAAEAKKAADTLYSDVVAPMRNNEIYQALAEGNFASLAKSLDNPDKYFDIKSALTGSEKTSILDRSKFSEVASELKSTWKYLNEINLGLKINALRDETSRIDPEKLVNLLTKNSRIAKEIYGENKDLIVNKIKDIATNINNYVEQEGLKASLINSIRNASTNKGEIKINALTNLVNSEKHNAAFTEMLGVDKFNSLKEKVKNIDTLSKKLETRISEPNINYAATNEGISTIKKIKSLYNVDNDTIELARMKKLFSSANNVDSLNLLYGADKRREIVNTLNSLSIKENSMTTLLKNMDKDSYVDTTLKLLGNSTAKTAVGLGASVATGLPVGLGTTGIMYLLTKVFTKTEKQGLTSLIKKLSDGDKKTIFDTLKSIPRDKLQREIANAVGRESISTATQNGAIEAMGNGALEMGKGVGNYMIEGALKSADEEERFFEELYKDRQPHPLDGLDLKTILKLNKQEKKE
jgi:hypothetical protein